MNIQTIHTKYLQLGSLEKTCSWLKEEHSYEINRQRLSTLFKQHGLWVATPNGWPDLYWEDRTSHLDGESRLAAEMIRLAYEDLSDPNVSRADKMSAAYFLSSELYNACLTILVERTSFMIDASIVPQGLDVEDVIGMRELYERNRHYWLPVQ